MHHFIIVLVSLITLSGAYAQSAPTSAPPLTAMEVTRYGEGRLDTWQVPSAWSQDGTRLAVPGSRGSWVFDLTDPEAAPAFVARGIAESLLYPVYAPDGRYAVAHETRTSIFSADGTLLWEAEGYDPAWSADGSLVALHTQDDVFVLDAATGDLRHQRRFADTSAEIIIWDITFAGDPTLLYVETTDRFLSDTVVWDLTADTVTRIVEILNIPDVDRLTLIAVAPDGVTMVFARSAGYSYGDLFYVVNRETWEILEISDDYALPSDTATFSPDGSLFALKNAYGDTHFWRVSEAGWEYQSGLPTGGVPTFSPDGRLIALEDGVYEPETGAQVIDFRRVERRFIASPDGERAFDGDRTLFNVVTGETIASLDISLPPRGVSYSPDGTRLATWHDADGYSTLYLWNAHTGELQAEIARFEEAPSHPLNFAPLSLDQPATFPVNWQLTFSPDSSLLHIYITSAVEEDQMIVWDIIEDRRLPIGSLENARLLQFTGDNRLFLIDDTANRNQARYYLWDPRAGSPNDILRLDRYRPITISADTRLLAYLADEDIVIFDIPQERNLVRTAIPNADVMYHVGAFEFSDDNTQVTYTSYSSEFDSGTEYAFDIASGEFVTPPEPTALSFITTSDRHGVVGSGRSLLIYALDAEMDDAPLAEIVDVGVPVQLYFSPDGTHLVGNYVSEGVIIVWQLEATA